MGTVKLVITGHIVHSQGQQRYAGEDIIQPGGMIADTEEGAGFLAAIGFKGIVYVVFFIHKEFPYRAEDVVKRIGRSNPAGMDGLGNGGLFHSISPSFRFFCVCVCVCVCVVCLFLIIAFPSGSEVVFHFGFGLLIYGLSS